MTPFSFTYDHDADDFFHAIGLADDKMYHLVDKTVLYELVAPLALEALFDVPLPEGAKSMSGVFQRSLARIDQTNSELYMTFLVGFKESYRRCKKRLDKTNELKEKFGHESSPSIEMFKIKADSMEDAMEQLKTVMEVENTVKAIAFLKASKCDYQKFIDFTVYEKKWSDLLPDEEEEEEQPDPKYKAVDDLLKDIMSKEDED